MLGLKSQRFNWIQFGSLIRRIYSKKDSYSCRYPHSHNDPANRKVHGKWSQTFHGKGDYRCKNHAQHSAHGGHDSGFDQELQQDIAARGAQRLAHADLSCSLGDAGQHNVHDHNAPDHQKNRHDANRYGRQAARHVVVKVHDGRRFHHAEIIFLLDGQMPPRAQQHAGLVFGRLHQVGRESFDIDVHAHVAAIHLAPGLDRNVDEAVLRLSKRAAYLLGNAHYFVRFTVNVNGFSQRIHVGKEALGHVHADHGHVRAVQIVGLANVAPKLRLLCVDPGHVRRHAAHVDVLDRLGFVFDHSQPPRLQPHRICQGHVVAHVFILVEGYVLVGPRQLDELLGAGDQRKAHHQEHVGAEVRNFLRYIRIGALDHGHHYDQG